MTGQLFLAVNNAFVGLLHACETVFTSTGSLPYWISGVVFCFAVKQIIIRALGGDFSGVADDKALPANSPQLRSYYSDLPSLPSGRKDGF